MNDFLLMVQSQIGTETVSLALYVVTVVVLIISNSVAVTIAIYKRPTRKEVTDMINEQLQEKSYLGERLKNIETDIKIIKRIHSKENI